MKRAILLLITFLAAPAAFAANVRNVAIYLYDGAEILDFSGPSEVLQSASHIAGGHESPALDVFTVARTKEPLTSQGFVKILPQYSIDDAPKVDVLVIPGGNTRKTIADAQAMAWLKNTITHAEITLTVCTGAFPVAKLGFLDGKEITTWYGAIDRLQQEAPNLTVKRGRRFVDNDRFITTAGVSAGIDGALHLVARLFGRRVADQTAEYMEYHWTPEPYLATSYSYLNPSADARGKARQLAEISAEAHDFDAARRILSELTTANPADSATWLDLGKLEMEAKAYPAAARAFERAAASDDLRAAALYNAACAYALSNQKPQAMASLTKSFEAGMPKDRALQDPDLALVRDSIK